jgi:hypothetical protein
MGNPDHILTDGTDPAPETILISKFQPLGKRVLA